MIFPGMLIHKIQVQIGTGFTKIQKYVPNLHSIIDDEYGLLSNNVHAMLACGNSNKNRYIE